MMQCKYCSSKNIKIFKQINSIRSSDKYNLYSCLECNSRFFNECEHEFNIDSFYDDDFLDEQFTSSISFKKSIYWSSQVRKIVKYCGKYPQSVLDVGCRTGDFLMHFNSETKRDGIEISTRYANVAKERGLKVFCNNIQNIDFEDRYDVVTAYAVVEHLTDPLTFLSKVQSIIRPGGILIIMVPTFECLMTNLLDRMAKKQWRMYTPPEHLNYISMQFLDHFLKAQGLSIVNRYWTSGGVINPVRNIPILSTLFKGLMFGIDESILNKLPLFDHQYSIYKKE